MIFKFFRKKNGDVIEFYIDEDNKTITKYKNEVVVKNEIPYLSYSSKLIELCDDEEERKMVRSL